MRHEPQASRAHKRVATEDQKERQRQERLAKSRATAAVSRYVAMSELMYVLTAGTLLPLLNQDRYCVIIRLLHQSSRHLRRSRFTFVWCMNL